MPDISTTTSEAAPASGEREEARPDLRDAPESPPADDYDVERGREKLERVLAK